MESTRGTANLRGPGSMVRHYSQVYGAKDKSVKLLAEQDDKTAAE
jgi:hypothetical protein